MGGGPPDPHTHAISDVTGLQTALDGKAPLVHDHDDLYYTEAEMDAALALKSNVGHNHDSFYYTEAEIDSQFSLHASSGDHDGRYYTKTQLDAGQLDTRYYTEAEIVSLLNGYSVSTHKHEEIYNQVSFNHVPSVEIPDLTNINIRPNSAGLIRHLSGVSTGSADNLGNIVANAAATFRLTAAHINATAVNTAIGNLVGNAVLATDQYTQWYNLNPTTGVITVTRAAVVLGIVKVIAQNSNTAVNSFVQLLRTGGPVDTAYCGGPLLNTALGVCVMNLASGNTIWMESNAAASNTLTLNATWSHLTLIALEL